MDRESTEKTRETIRAARTLLELPDRATRDEIQAICRALLRRWHPDTGGDKSECEEMTRKILAARKAVFDYCDNYRYDFSDAELESSRSGEEWWQDRFGNDPMWGGMNSDS